MTVAGLVLVRQKPGSAKGVMFITIEDETDIANLIIWPSLFEKQRRLILSAGMIGCRGRVQREGRGDPCGGRAHDRPVGCPASASATATKPFPLPHGRGDEAKHGGGPDSREATRSDASRAKSISRISGSAAASRSRRGISGRAFSAKVDCGFASGKMRPFKELKPFLVNRGSSKMP